MSKSFGYPILWCIYTKGTPLPQGQRCALTFYHRFYPVPDRYAFALVQSSARRMPTSTAFSIHWAEAHSVRLW